MKKQKKKRTKEPIKLENLKQLNLNAAGLDIGASEIYAAVPQDRDTKSVKVFKTFTIDLYELANWLKACGVDTVAMESTSVYWIPVYEILESRGFDVNLINARQIKNVPGRKSDIWDCQWIQQLHTYGLLRASFRPEEEMCALRTLIRHRDSLIQYRSSHIQHIQKALHLMNVQLTNVITDITGLTGMKIIRAIVDGERNLQKLASYRNHRCAKSEEEIEKSLKGNYKKENVFILKQALQLYDFYHTQIRNCDEEIEKNYSAFKPRIGSEKKTLKKSKGKRKQSGGNEPQFDLRSYLYKIVGVDLTKIDGINVLIAQTIITEIGVDMSAWKSVKHFTSWLGLCPQNEISGGKILKTGTKKTKSRANKALRMAAQSVSRSSGVNGCFFRRIRSKRGSAKAIVATAHKLAKIIYNMLKYQQEYIAPNSKDYEEKYQKQMLKNLQRKAAKLGLKLEPIGA